MAGGRKPLPTQLKLIKGTLRKDRQTPNEPIVTVALAGVPEHLTERQKELWRETVACAPSGLLKQLDASVLEVYIVALDAYREAQVKVQELGSVVRSPNNYPQVSPFMAIMNKQAVIMLKAASEMGFTPASRTRISVTPETVQDNPWAKLASDVQGT